MALDITSYLLGKLSGGGGGSPVIPPEAGTLLNIVVGTLPKTSYIEGEPLDLTGCVIYGNYSNGGQYDVTSGCTFIANNPVLYTDTKIVVTYETATLDIPITVAGAPVKAPASTVALYHCDDNLKDEVSGVEGSGTKQYTAGKFGKSIVGQNSSEPDFSKIRITNAEMLSGKYTIEFWGKFISSSSTGAPYIHYHPSWNSTLFDSNIKTSGLTPFFKQNTTYTNPTPNYDSTTWNHFAVVIDNGNFRTYLNGILSAEGTIQNNSNYNIGAFKAYGTACAFDEALFCNDVKYTTNFAPPHGPYYIEE